METKQTVVEWMEKELDFLYQHMSQDDIKWFYEKAKQMNKEQMKFFFECGRNYQLTGEGTFEKTYNETYGKS